MSPSTVVDEARADGRWPSPLTNRFDARNNGVAVGGAAAGCPGTPARPVPAHPHPTTENSEKSRSKLNLFSHTLFTHYSSIVFNQTTLFVFSFAFVILETIFVGIFIMSILMN